MPLTKILPQKMFLWTMQVFRLYDSIYRAKENFQADKIIIVTQKYHLYRALYISNSIGLDS